MTNLFLISPLYFGLPKSHNNDVTSNEWALQSKALWQNIEDEMVTARYLRWQAYVLREHSRAIRRERQEIADGAGQEKLSSALWDSRQPIKPLKNIKPITDIDVGEVWDH